MIIVPATAQHAPGIEALLDRRFGPARRNRTAYRLRDGATPIADLSKVALDGDALLGSIQCWPIRVRGLSGRTDALVLLGPVATAAGHEGQGIASDLMRSVLAEVDSAGHPPVLLIGDAPFYGRFGFVAGPTRHWQMPGPVDRARLLLRGDADALPHWGWVEPAAPVPVRRAA
jgi:predicted N-acetyltransferase YhbS